MTYYNPNMYTQSDSLDFGVDSAQMDANILRGRRSVYQPNLPLAVDYLLTGQTPADTKEFDVGIVESLDRWMLSFVNLPSTNIYAEGSPGMLSVLPKDSINVIMYEDEVPEPTKFDLNGAVTFSGTDDSLEFTLSSTAVNGVTPIYNLQVNDLIVNWDSNGYSVVGRVSAVTYASNTFKLISIGTTFTAYSDFATTDTSCSDKIEIIGTGEDFLNATLATARTTPDLRTDSVSVKTYNVQRFEDFYDHSRVFDPKLRAYDSNSPKAERNMLDALWKHKNKMSRALLWGKASNVTSSHNRSTFAGIANTISTNVTTLSNRALALSHIDEMLIDKLGGTRGSNRLLGLCSIQTLNVIESLFNTLGSTSDLMFKVYEQGRYTMETKVIRYRGREIHLLPCADFMDQGTRTFPDQTTTGAGYADALWLIDPSSIFSFVGQHHEEGPVFFKIRENLQSNAATFEYKLNAITSFLGFALCHEKTSGVIKNIGTPDLAG